MELDVFQQTIMETKSSQSGPPAFCVFSYKLKDEPGLNFPCLIETKMFCVAYILAHRYATFLCSLDVEI